MIDNDTQETIDELTEVLCVKLRDAARNDRSYDPQLVATLAIASAVERLADLQAEMREEKAELNKMVDDIGKALGAIEAKINKLASAVDYYVDRH